MKKQKYSGMKVHLRMRAVLLIIIGSHCFLSAYEQVLTCLTFIIVKFATTAANLVPEEQWKICYLLAL